MKSGLAGAAHGVQTARVPLLLEPRLLERVLDTNISTQP